MPSMALPLPLKGDTGSTVGWLQILRFQQASLERSTCGPPMVKPTSPLRPQTSNYPLYSLKVSLG